MLRWHIGNICNFAVGLQWSFITLIVDFSGVSSQNCRWDMCQGNKTSPFWREEIILMWWYTRHNLHPSCPTTLRTWNTASMAPPIYMKWLNVLSFKENVKPLDSPYWISPTRPCQLHLVMSKCWLDGLESESLWWKAFRSVWVNTCRAAFSHEGRRWSVEGHAHFLPLPSSEVKEQQAGAWIQKIAGLE